MAQTRVTVFLLGSFYPNQFNEFTTKPTNKDVLRMHYHYHFNEKHSKDSAKKVLLEKLLKFYDKSEVKTLKNIKNQISVLIKTYDSLKKHELRKTKKFIQNKIAFKKKLTLYFDILSQRKKAPPVQENKTDEEIVKLPFNQLAQCSSSSSHSDVAKSTSASTQHSGSDYVPVIKKRKLENRECNKSNPVEVAIDRCNLSYRKASHFSRAIGQKTSKSTTYRRVQKSRDDIMEEKLERLSKAQGPFQVYWDGKKINSKNYLVVNASSGDTKETIGVKPITNGTGKTIAETVFGVTEHFKISTHVFGFCFDTTSSNSGEFLVLKLISD